MNRVLDKELISQLSKLGNDKQEKVLAYINELIEIEELNKRAINSEKAIEEGRTKSFDQFNEEFEQWKVRKRATTK